MSTKDIVWAVLITSGFLLLLLVTRHRGVGRVLAGLGVNVVVAVFLLYAINLLSAYTHFELPINTATLATVTVLGIPGVMMLAGLKWVLL